VETEEETRAELGRMTALLPGNWRVVHVEAVCDGGWGVVGLCLFGADGTVSKVAALAYGETEAEAYRNLLERWRDGGAEGVPPAGSEAELRLRLAAEGRT